MRVGKSGERGCRLGVPYGFSDESGIVFVSASNDECQSKDCIYEDRDIKACKNIPVNHVNCTRFRNLDDSLFPAHDPRLSL